MAITLLPATFGGLQAELDHLEAMKRKTPSCHCSAVSPGISLLCS